MFLKVCESLTFFQYSVCHVQDYLSTEMLKLHLHHLIVKSGAEAGRDISIPLKFALPGKERQDSVRSGLQVGVLSCRLLKSSLITNYSHVLMQFHLQPGAVQNK